MRGDIGGDCRCAIAGGVQAQVFDWGGAGGVWDTVLFVIYVSAVCFFFVYAIRFNSGLGGW